MICYIGKVLTPKAEALRTENHLHLALCLRVKRDDVDR